LEIFHSFRSWANDGSHLVVFEEFEHSPGGATTEMYLSVFERVFRELQQGEHYDMMMSGLD
jgi:wobble nucleotide-excising tRNase